MKTTTKKQSDTKVEINVILDADDLRPARTEAVKKLAQHINVQGFRKGKAPLSVIEQHLSPNDIASEALDIAIRSNLSGIVAKEQLLILAIKNVNVTKYVPDETAEFTVEIETLSDVKLGNYKKLKAKKDVVEPTEADVQEIVDNIVAAYAEKKVAKKPAASGDEVIIDFTGKKDGVAFDGGTAKDYHLDLGSGQFIPGFEEGIVGHNVGDKFDLELTFPKDYHEKSLAGQPVVFEVLLKQVNEVVKPAADDELAKKCGNFATIKELRDDIKKNLAAQNAARATEKYRDALVQELVEASNVSAPDLLIQDQLRYIKDDAVRNAASHGLSFEQYLNRLGKTAEEWDQDAKDLAEARVKASLVLQVLARDEKISASDEEVDAKIAELKDVYKNAPEALENLSKPEVRQDVKNRMTIDKTLEFLENINQPASSRAKKSRL